jgi:hypothetical protein
MTAVGSTSGRLHREFVRLLFLQTHRETDHFLNFRSFVSAIRSWILPLPPHGLLCPTQKESWSDSGWGGRFTYYTYLGISVPRTTQCMWDMYIHHTGLWNLWRIFLFSYTKFFKNLCRKIPSIHPTQYFTSRKSTRDKGGSLSLSRNCEVSVPDPCLLEVHRRTSRPDLVPYESSRSSSTVCYWNSKNRLVSLHSTLIKTHEETDIQSAQCNSMKYV